MGDNKLKRSTDDYKELRKLAHSLYQYGLTQIEIAEKLDLSENTVCNWKRLGDWKVKTDEEIESNLDSLMFLISQTKQHNELLYKKLLNSWLTLNKCLKSKGVIKK